MVSQKIQAKNPFTVGGQVYFELPFSDWQLSMYNIPDVSTTMKEKTDEESLLNIELLADAGLLQQSDGDDSDSKTMKYERQSTNMRRVL